MVRSWASSRTSESAISFHNVSACKGFNSRCMNGFRDHFGSVLSLPVRERKDFLGFSLFAESLENPREGIFSIMHTTPLSCDFSPTRGEISVTHSALSKDGKAHGCLAPRRRSAHAVFPPGSSRKYRNAP